MGIHLTITAIVGIVASLATILIVAWRLARRRSRFFGEYLSRHSGTTAPLLLSDRRRCHNCEHWMTRDRARQEMANCVMTQKREERNDSCKRWQRRTYEG